MTHSPSKTVSFTKDPSGAAAFDLDKVRETNPDLAKKADKAGLALSKRDLSGVRAQVVVVLDHSGSMSADYQNGSVQTLVERALGFALQVDVDGEVPVIPFDGRVWPTVDVNVNNYADVVNREIYKKNQMGSTNLTLALEEVRKLAEKTDAPLFAIVITDGNPDNKSTATAKVVELAGYPVFLKFLALREVSYLSELDDLDASKRLLDNVDAKPEAGSGQNLLTATDLEFAEAMVDEWDSWIADATKANVLS